MYHAKQMYQIEKTKTILLTSHYMWNLKSKKKKKKKEGNKMETEKERKLDRWDWGREW